MPLALLCVLSLVPQVPSFPPESALQGKRAGELVLAPGRYGDAAADWGWLLVPENRSDPDSRTIRLAVVRQRATEEASDPPLFNLVGGPGQSNVFGSGELPAELLRRSDGVRVGYRGIDGDVELQCPEFVRALQTDNPLARASVERARGALRACHARLTAAGIDLDGYDLVEVVDDIEAARAALGYERIDLLAVSWGTQIALTHCARHPGRVRRMRSSGARARRGAGRPSPSPRSSGAILRSRSRP